MILWFGFGTESKSLTLLCGRELPSGRENSLLAWFFPNPPMLKDPTG
jgi:hypothetical protein